MYEAQNVCTCPEEMLQDKSDENVKWRAANFRATCKMCAKPITQQKYEAEKSIAVPLKYKAICIQNKENK